MPVPQHPVPQPPVNQNLDKDSGKYLGKYLIRQALGQNREGGRVTYLASDPTTNQSVVLKQFRFAQTDSSWSGFKSHEREIAMLQAIAHPQVPRYLDSFETEDGFCMVQEYKDAPSLAEKTYLTLLQIQKISHSMLEILADLQQQAPPIIHRDIKPENILVGDDLQVYLIDFGLAKLNQESVAVSSIAAGTPGFMPPEEFFNRPLTTAADLYSVGATLIALLTQTPPSEMSHLLDDSYRLNFTAKLPPINPDFVDWLTKMVEPSPRDRFPDAATALRALKPLEITLLSPHGSRLNTDGASVNGVSYLSRKVSDRLIISIAVGGCLLFALFAKKAPFVPNASTTPSYPAIIREQLASISQSRDTSGGAATPAQSAEVQWFEAVKPHCNSLEVITTLKNNPYPASPIGAGFGASCYALAGKLNLADQAIAALPKNQQGIAAMVLFEIGHPVADQGDDESAGPIMDLVLKYWPENYMARYHAGMSAYVLAENDKAIAHLELFLDTYTNNDGWRQKALLAIDNIQNDIPADERFKVHH